MPVDVDLRVDVHVRAWSKGRVGWFFGRVSRSLCRGEGAEAPEKPRKTKSAKKPWKGPGVKLIGLGRDLLHIDGFARSIVRLLCCLRHCIRVRLLRGDFRADLGDPADTCLLLGPLSQATLLTGACSPCSFRLMPSFDGVLLAGEAKLGVPLIPLDRCRGAAVTCLRAHSLDVESARRGGA